jgi:hypothetical protein
MKNKPLLFTLIYAPLVIIFKLWLFYSDRQMSGLGMYSHLLSLLVLTPFCFFLVKKIRDEDFNGIISGRNALKESLKFVLFSGLILSVFNYIFFEAEMGRYMANYILDVGPGKMKEEALKAKKVITDAEIKTQLTQVVANLSAFRDTTFKLLSIMAFGVFSSFISSVFLKRSPK